MLHEHIQRYKSIFPVQSSFTELKGQFAKIQHDLCLAQQKIENLDVTCKNLAQEKTALAEQFSQLGDKLSCMKKLQVLLYLLKMK